MAKDTLSRIEDGLIIDLEFILFICLGFCFLFTYLLMCSRSTCSMSMGVVADYKRLLGALELTVSCEPFTGMLGNEFGSFGRAVCIPNH